MKTNLDLATKLHYELNLDNFYVANIRQWGVSLQGWYSPDMEKLLFDKGYQVLWNENLRNFKYESDQLTIILTYEEI
jgi:hypothetical protein